MAIMFKGIRASYQAEKGSYFIEWATTEIVNKLIIQGIHLKTHDTIFIFKEVCSYTINLYSKLTLLKYDDDFDERVFQKTKENLKPWLVKILNVGTSETIAQSIEVVVEQELDEHCDEWTDRYFAKEKENYISMEKFGSQNILEYLSDKFQGSISGIQEESIYRILLRIQTELTK